jgi:hypothetical protein
MNDALLLRVLDTLLPGEGPWPSAGSLDLVAPVRGDVADLDALLARLPAEFSAGDQDAREQALRRIESAEPERFERLITAVYTAYYTQPRVRQVIEQETGYEARPPQPLGYSLEPFDERLLDRQRQRKPFWRKV